jgi:hypothetical protein
MPSSLPLLHHQPEVMEQVVRVVRPRRGFGVVLHAEERQRFVAQAFKRLVVQVNVGQLNFVGIDRVGIDGEVVVVGRDLDLAGGVVLDRVVAAVVAEFELVGLAAEGQTRELVTEADSENRNAAQKFANGAHRIIHRLGIAGAVGEKDSVGLQLQHIFGSGLCRNHRHAAALAGEHSQECSA